jgi:hypothetical protein
MEMNDKQTLAVLVQILKNHPLSEEEITAIKSAIGLLSWTKLIEGKVQSIKKSRARRNNL